ncbi:MULTISPECIES: FecR domain-containing protein [Sphingobacterium]|uniref:FecR domain-containing protein n=1 Tax=Sphingobacterium TaxID=28453 RepID=UPI0013D982C7|nr:MULTISPECIES: FecR domain-containing protein [unclassified Sphingobacterium]
MKLETNIKELFSKYLSGQASARELLQLLDYFQEESDSGQLRDLILDELREERELEVTSDQRAILARVSLALHDRIQLPRQKVRRLYWSWGAAAVLLLVGLWGSYLWMNNNDILEMSEEQLAILPGEDKATLVLQDGSIIALDSSTDIEGKESLVFKDSSGMLTFSTANLPTQDKGEIRTVRTPKGGQFAVVLADGTKVWLNAESSITFPTQFKPNTREVDITGEAYFEVAKREEQPFIVQTRKQTIKVLGTHFNVNAYPERGGVQTSLLEGRVAVTAGGRQIFLRPGEMSVWDENKGGLNVEKIVGMENLLAWKEGMFSFDNNTITEIMQTLSRWYDIDIAFEKADYSDCVFDGMVPKKENIEQVLKILSVSQQLHFDIKGRKVIVSRLKSNKN